MHRGKSSVIINLKCCFYSNAVFVNHFFCIVQLSCHCRATLCFQSSSNRMQTSAHSTIQTSTAWKFRACHSPLQTKKCSRFSQSSKRFQTRCFYAAIRKARETATESSSLSPLRSVTTPWQNCKVSISARGTSNYSRSRRMITSRIGGLLGKRRRSKNRTLIGTLLLLISTGRC